MLQGIGKSLVIGQDEHPQILNIPLQKQTPAWNGSGSAGRTVSLWGDWFWDSTQSKFVDLPGMLHVYLLSLTSEEGVEWKGSEQGLNDLTIKISCGWERFT